MDKERKKNEIRVPSEGAVEEVGAESNAMKKDKKKKKKGREDKDNFSGKEIAACESEKLGEDALVKKKESEKERVNSEAADDVGRKSKKKSKEKMADSEIDDVGRKSKKKSKEKMADSEIDDDGVKKSMKENEEARADSEADDGGGKKSKKEKIKKKSGGDEKALVNTDEADKEKTGKRKRDNSDLGAEENTDEANKEVKRKSKKKKASVDSQVEEDTSSSGKDAKKKQSEDPEAEGNDLNSTKDAKKKRKKKKQSEDPEAEANNKESTQDAKKKQSENSEAEENDLNSKKDAKRKGKKKQSEDREGEVNNNEGTKDATKKRKKKQKCSKSDEEVTTPSSKSAKKVKFSDQVEVFPTEDEGSEEEEDEEGKEEEERVELVRGKRFTKEEDELIKKSVYEYIDKHALGEEGLSMVLACRSHPQVRGCWKEITAALPWRPLVGVYHRAHSIFEEGSKGVWTKEEFALVMDYYNKNGSGDWKALGDAMGKNRKHVKDAWRRIRLTSKNKGHWSREEYQTLFDLVNKDLRMKAFQEKREQHGMLRDNIPWMVISDQLKTRDHTLCCIKWYDQLTSPMVAQGIWANVDDYRLLDVLTNLDAACVDDVDWDNLLDNRDGEACRKRWDQMVRHIGLPGTKTFAEQVEILSQRYCPDIGEDREDFDNRPFDPED